MNTQGTVCSCLPCFVRNLGDVFPHSAFLRELGLEDRRGSGVMPVLKVPVPIGSTAVLPKETLL